MNAASMLSGRRPLALIAVLFAITVWRCYSPDAFGTLHDDTLLTVSAKSLAEGQGYRIASWPGAPAQTKYPPLYPLLVSAVWRLSADFPANLPAIHGIAVLGGFAYLAGCWVWLSMRCASRLQALILASICALHPVVAYLSASALTDIPFAAFFLWGALLGERALAPDRRGSRRTAAAATSSGWPLACWLRLPCSRALWGSRLPSGSRSLGRAPRMRGRPGCR
jgi:hypothetical protein